MILLRKPSLATIQRFLAAEKQLRFTYDGVGATARTNPPGYTIDWTRVRLGTGEATFLAARKALESWRHFELGWVEAAPLDTPVRPDAVIGVLIRSMGLWWLNSARIVYVVDEHGPVRCWGFAYGTLPGHAESGEERFRVEWHVADDSVWYDILAFSRPRHILARLGKPLVRRLQKRFARDSCAALRRAVGSR
jgi:uncharacterized protein (UPF0548 family)